MSSGRRAFLDANVVFSAALGGPALELLLDLARERRIEAMTSVACEREARENLSRKRPDRIAALEEILRVISVEEVETTEHEAWARKLVHHQDVHVLAAARALSTDVLVTGDMTHFGRLMSRSDLLVKVRSLRGFLLEGPEQQVCTPTGSVLDRWSSKPREMQPTDTSMARR